MKSWHLLQTGPLAGCPGCHPLVRSSSPKLSKASFRWGNTAPWCFFLWWPHSSVDLPAFLSCHRMNNGDWGLSHLCVPTVIPHCLLQRLPQNHNCWIKGFSYLKFVVPTVCLVFCRMLSMQRALSKSPFSSWAKEDTEDGWLSLSGSWLTLLELRYQ